MVNIRPITKEELEAFINRADKLVKETIKERLEFLEELRKQIANDKLYFEYEMGKWNLTGGTADTFLPGNQIKKAQSIIEFIEKNVPQEYSSMWEDMMQFGKQIIDKLRRKDAERMFIEGKVMREDMKKKLLLHLSIIEEAKDIITKIKFYEPVEVRIAYYDFDGLLTSIVTIISSLNTAKDKLKEIVDLYEHALFTRVPAKKAIVIAREHEDLLSFIQNIELKNITKENGGKITEFLKKYGEFRRIMDIFYKTVEKDIIKPLDQLKSESRRIV